MATYQDVLDAARTLSAVEQLRLASVMWEDVPPGNWPMPDEAWVLEAQQRSGAYDEGSMTAKTWPEVKAHARRSAGLPE